MVNFQSKWGTGPLFQECKHLKGGNKEYSGQGVRGPAQSILAYPIHRPFPLHVYEWWWAVRVDFWGLSSLRQALFYSSPAP